MQEIAVIILVAAVVFMVRNFMVKQDQLEGENRDSGEKVLEVKASIVENDSSD